MIKSKEEAFQIAKKVASESVPFDIEKALEIDRLNKANLEQSIIPIEPIVIPKTARQLRVEKRKQIIIERKRKRKRIEMAKKTPLSLENNLEPDTDPIEIDEIDELEDFDAEPEPIVEDKSKFVLDPVNPVNPVKNKVTETIEIDDFVPTEGVPKRVAWKRWQNRINVEYLEKGIIVIVKKANGTTEILTPNDTKSVKENTDKKALVDKLAQKTEKKRRKKEALEKRLSLIKHIDDPEDDFEAFIEIAVSCTWYQKRLTWMLSSVLNQQGNVPKIIFNVAYPENNGDPTTEKVCEFFRNKGMNIKETVYNDFSIMQFRGFVRNRQLIESKAKWMLFADCDMVYSPYFFEDLAKQLRTTYKNESRCLSARRVSLNKDHCKKYFNADPSSKYPRVVEEINQVEKWPVYMVSSACGAGYFQLINVRTHRANTDGLYVTPFKNPDMPEHDAFHKTFSDKTFRQSINGVVRIKTKPQYHLNHERDNETGKKHLTLQR